MILRASPDIQTANRRLVSFVRETNFRELAFIHGP